MGWLETSPKPLRRPELVAKRFNGQNGRETELVCLQLAPKIPLRKETTTLAHAFVDLWGLTDWMAKDFIKRIEEEIDDILSWQRDRSQLAAAQRVKAEKILESCRTVAGFSLPSPEVLFTLKLTAWLGRKNSPKGRKDLIDLASLLELPELDCRQFKPAPTGQGEKTLATFPEFPAALTLILADP